MRLHTLIDDAYQTLLNQLDNTRVALLHPSSRYRSMLIARLINDSSYRVFYYALGPDDIKLQAFLASITHDMANQHPTFGRHINMLPRDVYENPSDHFDTVLDTFVADLTEISDDNFILVLDEYDRSDTADDVQRFVEKLAGRLPGNGRMVINSRTLPRLPWVSMIAAKEAVMLEDSKVIQTDFYDVVNNGNTSGNGGTPLEVFALGPGYVQVNSKPIETWEGHLPRLLFFFALDRALVTRSEICHAFWPELESDQAVNVFHVTKRRLHKALDFDVLVHDDGYYRINPAMGVYYDVMEFTSNLMVGRNSDDADERFNAFQRVVDLYRGPFLQGHSDGWIDERRESYRAGYMEALTKLAHMWIDRERYEQALVLLQKALEEDKDREDLHRDLMQLYTTIGRRSEAAAHYQKAKEEGIVFTPETHDFYEHLMND